MKHLVLKRLRAALLGATFLYAPAAARAEPISATILSALAIEATATALAVTTTLLTLSVSVGATLISRAFEKKPGEEAQTEKGAQTQLTIGANVPRNRVYGKQAIAGQLAYWNLYGPDNVLLQLVYNLGAGPHQFFGMLANGKRCTLGGVTAGLGQAITDFEFAGFETAWVNFYQGFYDQAADGSLIANAQPAGRWTANHRGRGVCYAIVTLGYKPEAYPQGLPQFQFEIGALLYDARKDGSTGGVGAHRWNDQHTWEWSGNPALGLYEYERGFFIGTHRVIGRGLAPVDILRGAFIDAANICDEVVTNKDGTTEPRYRIGMNVGGDRELKSVEADFCTAFAGSLVEQAGAYGPIVGAAQDVVATFTDDDLVDGKPVRYSDKRPRDQLVNALFGVYSEPAQNYQAIPYAPRTSAADEAADGDRFAGQRDYIQILSQAQAQRVGEIDRREGRYQGTGSVTLGFRFSYLEAADWVRWISARRGFDKTFRVTQHRLAPDQTITLALDETASEVFGFDRHVDELDPLAPGDLPGIGGRLSTVPDLSAEQLQLVDAASGLKTPAIRALWSPILDRTVDRVRLQYRLASQPDAVHDSDPFPPDDGEGIIAAGIQAGGAYQVRGTIDTTPVRTTTWTAWEPVTAPSQHIVPNAQTAAAADAVPASGILGQIITAQIANAAITAAKIAAAAVTATAFAAGIEPVAVVSAVPSAAGYTGPKNVFNTTDGKIYRYASGAFTTAVPTVDLTGQIATVQIQDVAITSVKLADLSVATAKLADAAITAAKLAAAAVTFTAFAAGIQPASVVSALPSAGGYTGPSLVFNVADGKLYRYTAGAFVATIPTTDLTGQVATTQIVDNAITAIKVATAAIGTTQIADSSITTAKVVAHAITANEIAANTITAGQIAANTITASQIAANTITASQIAANTITATQIAANTITASQIAANTLTAGTIAAGAIGTTQLAAGAVTTAILSAGAITADKLAVGSGKNMVPNSDFLGGIGNVQVFTGSGAPYSFRAEGIGSQWAPAGMNAVRVAYDQGVAAAAGTDTQIAIYNYLADGTLGNYPVEAGKYYEASAVVEAFNANGFLFLVWIKEDGSLSGYTATSAGNLVTGAGTASGTASSSLTAYPRSGVIALAPPDAASCQVLVRLQNNGAYPTYLIVSGVMLAPANANQTTLSAWTPAGATVIQGGQIVADSVTAAQIAASAITTNELAANAVTAAKIAANTITAAQIAASTITANEIAANTITANEIAANAITTSELAALAVTAAKIAANTITANEIAVNALTAGTIAAGAIGTAQLAAGAVTTGILAAGAITTAKLAVGTGSNMLANPDMNAGRQGHVLGFHSATIDADTWDKVSVWAPVNMGSGEIHSPNAAAGQSAEIELRSLKIDGTTEFYPAVEGQRYEFSFHGLNFWNGTIRAVLIFYNDDFSASDVFAGSTTADTSSTLMPNNNGSNYYRYGVFATCPAGKRWMKPVIRCESTGATGNAWLWWSACYLSPASPNQTEFTPFSSSGVSVIDGGQIVASSITAAQIQANAITAVKVGANQIVTTAANIAVLVVDNIHIRGAAITVPAFSSVGTATLDGNDRVLASLSVSVQGVNGSNIVVNAQASGIFNCGTANWRLYINGTQVYTGAQTFTNTVAQYPIAAIGGLNVTATGGAQTITAELRGQTTGGLVGTASPANLFLCAYLR